MSGSGSAPMAPTTLTRPAAITNGTTIQPPSATPAAIPARYATSMSTKETRHDRNHHQPPARRVGPGRPDRLFPSQGRNDVSLRRKGNHLQRDALRPDASRLHLGVGLA